MTAAESRIRDVDIG